MNIKVIQEYTKNINILYVEDDKVLRDSMTEIFETYFPSITTAEDGEEGLRKYKKNQDSFDLVISDILMPKMNGIDMCEKILEIDEFIPIIFLSAHNEIEYLQKSIEIGVSSFIMKPISKDILNSELFKVTRAIADRKYVLEHVDMIEELNQQLENQNKELLEKNDELKKSLRLLDTMVSKEQIVLPKQSAETFEVSDSEYKSQIQLLVSDDLHELRELQVEIDKLVIDIINSKEGVSTETINLIAQSFTRYASLLSYYTFFKNLSSAMHDFSLTIKNNPLPSDMEQVEHLFMLLESFLYVLEKWQNELEQENQEMINFFDASIISDMHTIIKIWMQEESTPEDGDIEFF